MLAEFAVPLEDFSSAMLTDEIALAQAALEEARDDASRYAAGDRLERLHSLQPRDRQIGREAHFAVREGRASPGWRA